MPAFVQRSSAKWWAIAGVFACALLPPIPAASQPPPASVYLARCDVDNEIAVSDQDQASAAALDFARDLTSGRADQAYAALSAELQSQFSKEDMDKSAALAKSRNASDNIKINHIYKISVVMNSKNNLILCNSPRSADASVILSMRPEKEQYYVEIIARGPSNNWSLFIWLSPESGSLKLLGYSMNIEDISGKTSLDLENVADMQLLRGHYLNTALLYQAAEFVAQRGPNAIPTWKTDLDEQVKKFSWPEGLTGPSPRLWPVGETKIPILGLSILGLGGKLEFLVHRKPEAWPSDSEIDIENRNLISNIIKYYPELSDIFEAVIISAASPDDKTAFSSVYVFGTGFIEPHAGGGLSLQYYTH